MNKTISLMARMSVVLAVTALATASTASADVITAWTYPTGEQKIKATPTAGVGAQALVGGATYTGLVSQDYYCVTSNGALGSGLHWELPTSRYRNIVVSLDIRRPDGLGIGRHWTWQYDTGDGWVDAADFTFGNQLFNTFTLDLSAITSANNNAAFAIRATTTDMTTTAFTVHFDNVTVSGTTIPEPASMGLMAVGGLAVLLRRRKA